MDNAQTLKPLTSIRGLAALWVYLYHRSNLTTGSAFFRQFAEDGYYGLDFFFILSGFIISYAHFDAFPTYAEVKKNVGRFLQLRLARIYPLYILLLLIFVNFQGERATFTDFLQHVLLMQSWGWSNNQLWNAPDWSISVEWLIYLLFPFFACAIYSERQKIFFNMLILASCFVLWQSYLKFVGQSIHDMTLPFSSLPRGILDFAIGVCLHNLYRRKFLEKLPWDALAVLAVAAVAGEAWAKSRDVHVPDIAVIGLGTVLIYALANIRSWGHYLFSNRALVYLGTISYSLYMLQWIYLEMVSKVKHTRLEGHPFFSADFAMETVGLIAAAVACYNLIEDPARQWLRGLIDEDRVAEEK